MKKTVLVFLSILLIASLITSEGISLFSFAVEESPLIVSISPGKSSYGVFDNAKITVSIQNSSNKTVENVSAISSFSDIQPVGSGNTLFVENKTIQPGETITYSYSGRIKSSKLNLFQKIIMFFKNLFDRPKSVPSKNFDDGRNNTSSSTDFSIGGYGVKETVTVWFGNLIEPAPVVTEPEVVETVSSDEFVREVSSLIKEQITSSEFDSEKAINEPYYSCRLIVCGDGLNSIDLNGFSPDKVILNEDQTEAIIQFSTQSAAKDCEQYLNRLNNVEFAEADCFVSLYNPVDSETVQQDTSSDLTWGKSYMHEEQYARYLELNGHNDLITVAVVDSGVDMDHPFLKGRLLSNGWDLMNDDPNPDDDFGHGTHVAGIIADCTKGLNVKIMPIKITNREGNMSNHNMNIAGPEMIAQGIEKAANSGADIINLSLECRPVSRRIDKAVTKAVEKGSVVCVAAGNGDPQNHYLALNTEDVSPAHMDKAIVVGAVDQTGTVAFFSNYGSSVDVVAPGVGVYSTWPGIEKRDREDNIIVPEGELYCFESGTSMATPHISAAAAMLRLEHSDYTPEQIEDLIKSYCVDLGEPGRDDYYGNGRLDLYSAIPDCSIKYECNGGTAVANTTVKSTSEIELPETRKAYTITLNANGGTIASTTKTVDCTLDGWYRNSSYAGIRYAPHDHYMATRDETLYAKWETTQLGNMGTPTKSGCEFLGWFTAANGGTQYTAVSSLTGNLTLYAHWKAIAGIITTSSSNSDGKKLSVSWATSNGSVRKANLKDQVLRGTTTSFTNEGSSTGPTQGTWFPNELGGGSTVFEISNLNDIVNYISGLGATITKIEFSAVRANTIHGNPTGKGHLWAVTNTSSGFKHGKKSDGTIGPDDPNGTLIKDENWERGKAFSVTLTKEKHAAIINNFMNKTYRSFMFVGDTDLNDYIRMTSVSITIHYG